MMKDPENEAGLREIPAREILDKVQKGEPVDNCFIKGDLDFRGATPSKNVDFSGSKFSGDVDFSGSKFSGDVDFNGAEFSGDVDFNGAEFSGNVDFMWTKFCGKANFWRAAFCGNVDFVWTEFIKEVDFRDANFNGKVDFTRATFIEDVMFWGSTFIGDAVFEVAIFSKKADFREVRFSGVTNFQGAKFNQDANFQEAAFSGNAQFIYSDFQKESDFLNCRFDKLADFRGSKFKSIRLQDIDFEKIYLDWNSIEGIERHFDSKIYLSLIESYKTKGFFEDADNCHYQYRNGRRGNLSAIYYMADYIIMILYGYGVKPLRPLAGLVMVLVAFALIYSYLGIAGNTPMDALNTSSAILLSGTQLIVTPAYPAPGLLPYWVFTFEKLLGSLFFGLFLISIGRTIIR